MTFRAKNLSYVFESGRLSLVELLSATIAKFDPALVQEYADLLFVALFMVLANDDSTKCREAAAELVKSLYVLSEKSMREATITRLHTWAAQGNTLRRTAAHVIGLFVVESGADVALVMLTNLNNILITSASALADAEASWSDGDAFNEPDPARLDWRLAYHALSAILKVFHVKSDAVKNPTLVHWGAVNSHLVFPHAWVRLAVTRLISTLCGGFPLALPDPQLTSSHPLSQDGLVDLAHNLCVQLRSPHLDNTLSLQVVNSLKQGCREPHAVAILLTVVPSSSCTSRAAKPQTSSEVYEHHDGYL